MRPSAYFCFVVDEHILRVYSKYSKICKEYNFYNNNKHVCKHAISRVVRHHALNERVSRAFSAAGIPVKKEPTEMICS